jgi:hypothetical protein
MALNESLGIMARADQITSHAHECRGMTKLNPLLALELCCSVSWLERLEMRCSDRFFTLIVPTFDALQ